MSQGKVGSKLGVIDTAAALAGSLALARSPEDRLADLEGQLAKIEPLLEQLQKNSQTATNLGHYIRDLRKEQEFFNLARYVLAAFAGVVVLLLVALLWIAIWHSRSPLLQSPPAAIAAFVLGIVSGIVFLINSFAKGVFRSTAERHADGFLPPALEKGLEIYEKLTGKG